RCKTGGKLPFSVDKTAQFHLWNYSRSAPGKQRTRGTNRSCFRAVFPTGFEPFRYASAALETYTEVPLSAPFSSAPFAYVGCLPATAASRRCDASGARAAQGSTTVDPSISGRRGDPQSDRRHRLGVPQLSAGGLRLAVSERPPGLLLGQLPLGVL